MIKQTKSFFSEVMSELRKVTWPSKEEVKASTIVVLSAVFMLGLFIAIVDFIISKVITFII